MTFTHCWILVNLESHFTCHRNVLVCRKSCNFDASHIDRIDIDIPEGVLRDRSSVEMPRKLDIWEPTCIICI